MNKQEQAILCAYLDLMGAMEAYEAGDMHQHDWDAHRLSIEELVEAFPLLQNEAKNNA